MDYPQESFVRECVMTEEEAQRQDGKAFEAFNIKIDEIYRNPEYTLVQSATTVMTSTGWLKIFELNRLDGEHHHSV